MLMEVYLETCRYQGSHASLEECIVLFLHLVPLSLRAYAAMNADSSFAVSPIYLCCKLTERIIANSVGIII
jgi:hypothetical protein